MNRARAARATSDAVRGAFAVAFVLALVPVAFGLFFTGVDVARVDIPFQHEIRGLMALGQSLFISPSTGQGAPLLTSPNAQLFYPPRWLSFLFSPELGVHVHASLHVALMAAGTAWLARTFRLGVFASVTTGLTFALSGTALDLITHSTYLAGGAWLPVVWAGARRLKHTRDRERGFVALVMGLAMLLLAGEPHAFAIGCVVVVVECVAFAKTQRARASATVGHAVLAIVLAGAMGSILWLPALAELALSSRDATQSLPTSTVLARSFSPAEWPALVWPALLTDVGQGMQTFRTLVDDDPLRRIWNRTPYVGGLFLACLFVGLFARRARTALVIATVAFVFSLGSYGGVLPLLVEIVPPLGLFRFPTKYLVIATLAASIVVGIVLNHAARRDTWRRRLAVAAAIVVLAHGLSALALVVLQNGIDALPTPAKPGGLGASLPPFSSLWISRVLLALALSSVQLLLVLFLPVKQRALVVAVIVFELAAMAPIHMSLAPAFSEEKSPLASLARADAVFKTPLCSDDHTNTVVMYRGGETDRTEHARRNMRFGLSEMQAIHGLTSVVEYAPGAPRLAVSLVEKLESTPALARALGCAFWLTPHGEDPPGMRPLTWVGETGERVARLEGIRLLAVDEPLGDVALARSSTLRANDDVVLMALVAGEDPLSVVDDRLARLEPDASLPDGKGVRALGIESEDPHVVTVRAEGTGGAVVVVRTSFRVGWTASQNGRALPVVRAAGLFTGVVIDDVTAGDVTLRYVPPRFLLGALLAASSCVVFVSVLALARRRGKFTSQK